VKTDAERKFNARVKSMVENTDYEDAMNNKLKEAGLDKAPEFDFLNEEKAPRRGKGSDIRNSRLLKIAGFILAVFVVSGAMNIFSNTDFALASKFRFDNFMFSVKNGFLISDIQFETTSLGKELLLESEEQISIGKNYLKELKIPGFIPDGYKFGYLHIVNNPRNEYTATYTYGNDLGDVIVIKQEKLSEYNRDYNVFGINNDFYFGNVRIFYTSDIVSEYNSVYAFSEFERVHISGLFEHAVLLSIYEMLK